MIKKLVIILLLAFAFSCEDKSKVEEEIAQVPVDFEIIRFDQKFARVTETSLPELKAQYPFLFPERFSDSVWVQRVNDTIQQELNTEVTKAFRDFSSEEEELQSLFQHIKYYFPSFEAPTVITITSEVDYRNKVLLAKDYLFIALDTYLGPQHHFYTGIQEYLKKNFKRDQIIPDVATKFAEQYVPQPETKTFLSHMLYYGKILYLKDLWLPGVSDNFKIGYTVEELQWANENEEEIWKYFVERQILFDSNTELYSRFLYPAPFSKFYLEVDNESPALLGQYVGWQIIKKYMDRNDVSLKQMLEADAESIFNKANYKPRK